MAERDSIGGRVKRYARVGTTVGGMAARYAGGRFLGIALDRGVHAQELTAALGNLKGPLMKVAQILSTVPDVLPEEYAAQFTQLQTNAPSMGWNFVRRRMASELGADWQGRFAEFEHQAAAAASLGQVHRARAADDPDRWLACKLQYPDMGSAVEADLQQLKLIFALYRRYDRSIDPSQIHRELSERLREELDYRREAAHMRLYGRIFETEEGVHVPRPVAALSTDRLLTMNWLDGARLLDIASGPVEDRNRVAYNMFRAWYLPLYRCGVIHGDPHLGNYSVRADRSINLLDFGCMRIFPPSFVGAVIDLYHALRDGDEDLAVHAYETWGFADLDRSVIAILNQWAQFLYKPLLEDKVQRIQEESGPMYGARVAAKVHRELKEIGGVTPPREFVLMDRAAIGLGSVFLRLRAEMNWHTLFHDLIDDFDETRLAADQARLLTAAGVPRPDSADSAGMTSEENEA